MAVLESDEFGCCDDYAENLLLCLDGGIDRRAASSTPAQAPFHRRSSFRSTQTREHTGLREQREPVGHPPVLDDLAVDDPRLVEHGDVDRLT